MHKAITDGLAADAKIGTPDTPVCYFLPQNGYSNADPYVG
jgi:hypothetical protein